MLAPAIIPVDSRWRLPVWAPLATAFAFLLAFQLISPLGYVGGGADDWRYLEAARCLAREGYCTPETHWAARWPLVVPLALSLRLFGDGVVQASLAPAIYGLTALAAYQAIVARIWDVRVAAVAGVALVCTAAFSRPLFQPAVDVPEFALLALAVWLAERSRRTGGAGSALLAGACFGAALFARMAGVVFIPFLLLLVVARPDWRRPALLGLAGAGAILTADALIHLAIEGDALLSWRLALSHTRLPSSELASGVDTSRSPILNPDYIGGWRPASGIAAHWLLQGPVNLFMNPKIGPLLCVGVGVLILRRGEGWKPAAVAAAIAAALIYGLAIDPKPRLFLSVAGLVAIVVGRGLVAIWREGHRMPPLALIAMLIVTGAAANADRFSPAAAIAPTAERWAAELPGRIAATEFVRSELAFHQAIYALPDARTRPDLPALSIEHHGCGERALRSERIAIAEGALHLCLIAGDRSTASRAADPGP